jgi:hypothetical protein
MVQLVVRRDPDTGRDFPPEVIGQLVGLPVEEDVAEGTDPEVEAALLPGRLEHRQPLPR